MPYPIYVFIFWMSAISFISFMVTVADKLNAKRKVSRIPEWLLIFFAVLGGALAMFITMLIIRHKTRHKKFMVGIPVIMLIQIALAVTLIIIF